MKTPSTTSAEAARVDRRLKKPTTPAAREAMGRAIVAVRALADLTQLDLADRLDMSMMTLRSYEKGRRMAGETLAARVCEVAGVDAAMFPVLVEAARAALDSTQTAA